MTGIAKLLDQRREELDSVAPTSVEWTITRDEADTVIEAVKHTAKTAAPDLAERAAKFAADLGEPAEG